VKLDKQAVIAVNHRMHEVSLGTQQKRACSLSEPGTVSR